METELRAELDVVRVHQKDAHDRATRLRSEMTLYREYARSFHTQSGEEPRVNMMTAGNLRGIETSSHDGRKKRLTEKAAHDEAKAAELAKAIAEVEKEIAALDQRENELYEKMREP